MRVPSSDNVSVAVHEFGGTGRPLLLSHATGFHAHCYLPIGDLVADKFTTFALDHRGHGSTARPPDWLVDWDRFGDDTLAVAEAIAPDGGLIGFGHSMGATALLMAAHRRPGLFETIIGFEPIVFPTDRDPSPEGASPMVRAARNRRATFDSFEAAIANYASKPPMAAFDPDVRRLYVAHGFGPSPEGVRLKCDPEHEARTFEQGANHQTWDALADITCRVIVIAGASDGSGPAAVAGSIADRLPNALFIDLPTSNHLGPFIDPAESANIILDATR